MTSTKEYYPQIGKPFVACIGKFDGLHLGHRLVLDTLLDEAHRLGALSVVCSFEPRNGAPRLSTFEEKAELFESLGVDVLINAELTEAFMATPAEEFIRKLASCGQLKAVAVGQGFRFGQGAAGDIALLERLGAALGFRVHAVEPAMEAGLPVSSTRIRESVAAGDVEGAARLLGREYALTGEVVHGMQLATQLGFKTANILPPHGKALPAYGVYAAMVDAPQDAYPSMVNIGVKPTINGREPLIESHLIGFTGDLYGQRIVVRLVKRIRDEIKFSGVEELAHQLAKDITVCRELFASSLEDEQDSDAPRG